MKERGSKGRKKRSLLDARYFEGKQYIHSSKHVCLCPECCSVHRDRVVIAQRRYCRVGTGTRKLVQDLLRKWLGVARQPNADSARIVNSTPSYLHDSI